MLQCSLGKLDLLFHCSQYAEMVCSCVRLISGAIMVGLGIHYKKNEGEHFFWKSDPCPNGAAYWMFATGIAWIVINSLHIIVKMIMFFLRDLGRRLYHISFSHDLCKFRRKDRWVIIDSFISCVMYLTNVAVLTLGAFVVFEALPKWTDDYEDYKKEYCGENFCVNSDKNYCESTPMVVATILLILEFVLFPILIMALLYCYCYTNCCETHWVAKNKANKNKRKLKEEVLREAERESDAPTDASAGAKEGV